ncbi:MAG: hypothetical protein AABO57_23410 [Acidobacteriota bacterium]
MERITSDVGEPLEPPRYEAEVEAFLGARDVKILAAGSGPERR